MQIKLENSDGRGRGEAEIIDVRRFKAEV